MRGPSPSPPLGRPGLKGFGCYRLDPTPLPTASTTVVVTALLSPSSIIFSPCTSSPSSFLPHASKMANPKVFFDMTIGGAPAGRITMELRADVVYVFFSSPRQFPVADPVWVEHYAAPLRCASHGAALAGPGGLRCDLRAAPGRRLHWTARARRRVTAGCVRAVVFS